MASVVLLVAIVVLAQDSARSPVGKTILDIRVEGHRKVSEHDIRGQIRTRVGQLYDRETIQEDIRNIYSLGGFDSVEPVLEVTDAGVTLTFRVAERARIESVEFPGARSIKPADVAAEAAVAAGQWLDPGRLALARQKILDLYHAKGHYFAEVTLDRDALAANRVVMTIREGPRVRVRRIVFRGNDTQSSAILNRQIETSIRRWIISAGILDERAVKADVVRLVQYYRDQGYLDAEVSHELEFSADGQDVTVVFLVHEGPRYRVGSVLFEGSTVFQVHELRHQMMLQPDEYYTADRQQHDLRAIRENLYGAAGYINCQVEIRHGFADVKGIVNLVVSVQEGQRVFTGRIDIVGNEFTQERVIRRSLTIYPEQPYNELAAKDSRQRLLNTGLFREVTITPQAGPGDQRDILVVVEEGKTTSFLVGIGVSSDMGVLGNISLENRNFDLFNWPKTWGQMFTGQAFRGAGQTLRIVVEPGTHLNRFQVQFYEPYLLDKPIGLGTNLFLFTRPREAFDETRVGYIVSLNRRFYRHWSVEGAFRLEGVDIAGVDEDAPDEIRDDEGSHALLGGKFTLARDRTDSRFLPTRGDRLSVSVEPVGGTDTFVRLGADYRVYRTVRTDVYDRRSTVSGRVAVGYIAGDAPVYERFYAGGISTMRGFRYRGVSPRKGIGDDPVGGQFEVLAGAEYAFPLWGKSQGAVFLDTGTVEETASISTFRASTGFEVRIPIDFFGSIPLTFGVGVPLARDGKDETQWFYFLFGTSF